MLVGVDDVLVFLLFILLDWKRGLLWYVVGCVWKGGVFGWVDVVICCVFGVFVFVYLFVLWCDDEFGDWVEFVVGVFDDVELVVWWCEWVFVGGIGVVGSDCVFWIGGGYCGYGIVGGLVGGKIVCVIG